MDFTTIVRKTRGDDIDAACGQLAGEVIDRTRRTLRKRAQGEANRRKSSLKVRLLNLPGVITFDARHKKASWLFAPALSCFRIIASRSGTITVRFLVL
jgi:hypothetical protein